jgi:hypothetical protein
MEYLEAFERLSDSGIIGYIEFMCSEYMLWVYESSGVEWDQEVEERARVMMHDFDILISILGGSWRIDSMVVGDDLTAFSTMTLVPL